MFGGELFNSNILPATIIGFFSFCALSSGIYIINDIFDLKKDRLHPSKKFRPIAHGDIPLAFGLVVSVFLILISLYLGFLVTPAFFLLIVFFIILQVSYSVFLKNIAVIDILALAAGYILRVYGGEFASGLHISVWLLLTTISISLFIAVGKRRSELTLLLGHSSTEMTKIRQSLSHYSERLLDVYTSIFATSTFISYALFTFLENPSGFKISFSILLPDFLPAFFQKKWLMITILPVVYGIMRYMQDIYEKKEGESPERVLFSDKPLLFTVGIWVILVFIIIYVIGS